MIGTCGGPGFPSIAQAGFQHDEKVLGGGWKSVKHPAFKWVYTLLANLERMLLGIYRAVQPKHLPRYLAEFQYRFNRRYRLEDMVPRLL
jgi:hypothetical protein